MAYNMPYNPYPSYGNYGFSGQPYISTQSPMQNTFMPPQQLQNTYTQPQQLQNTQTMLNNQQSNQPVQSAQPIINNQIQMNPMQGISSSSRVVASKEEALAVSADFLGAPIIMPMIVNGEVSEIFVKQWDLSKGQAIFCSFNKEQNPNVQQYPQEQQTPTFATMENIQNIQSYINDLQSHIEQLENEIDGLKNRPVPTNTRNNSKKDKVIDGE